MKLFSIITLLFLSSCTSYFKSTRSKNISYNQNKERSIARKDLLKLNVFTPRKNDTPKEVLLFIHGGSWNSGNKGLYSFFGNRMAAKGVVLITINYTHSPKAKYNQMALEAAQSVKWIKENIAKYGGNPDKIFVSGHSAGGHLAALIAVDNRYFYSLKIENPIKGVVLIDAAGIDMYRYLKESNFKNGHSFLKTFTNNPNVWKEASALYYIEKGIPPFLQYIGGKTYSSIISSNTEFNKRILEIHSDSKLIVQKEKGHVQMMSQFISKKSPRYEEVLGFMRR